MVKGIKNGKKRNYRTVDEKVAILRRHLVDKVPVSDLCDEYGIQPSVFYGWHRQLIENMGAALEANGKRADTRAAQLERENEALRAKLAKKDSVIAEVSAEYVALKKELGEL
jgi:transposase-like protein